MVFRPRFHLPPGPSPAVSLLVTTTVASLWALELAPARVTGSPWVELSLTALVLVACHAVLRNALHTALVKMRPHGDLLAAAAVALGFATSFLLSALYAAGKLPVSLEDSRGGPRLLCAASATIIFLRFVVRDRAVLDPNEAQRRPGEVWRPAPVLLAAAAAALASLALASPASLAEGGISKLAAVVMAVLAASAIDRAPTAPRARVNGRLESLERALSVKKVYFEKSGVLTRGEPEVTAVHSLAKSHGPEEVLHLAAIAEYRIRHPIRDAILRRYKAYFRTVPQIHGVEHVPARGIRARYQGRDLLFGNLALFRENAWSGAPLEVLQTAARELSPGGETVLLLALAGEPIGAIALTDPLRPEAIDAARGLRELGLELGILSGDWPESVARLSAPLGSVDVRAGLNHEDSTALSASWRKGSRPVAIVRAGEEPDLAWTLTVTAHSGARGDGFPLPLATRSPLAVLEIFSAARMLARKEQEVSRVLSLYHILALPVVSGALEPWTGVPPAPAAAAVLGAVVPTLLSRRLAREGPLHIPRDGAEVDAYNHAELERA